MTPDEARQTKTERMLYVAALLRTYITEGWQLAKFEEWNNDTHFALLRGHHMLNFSVSSSWLE